VFGGGGLSNQPRANWRRHAARSGPAYTDAQAPEAVAGQQRLPRKHGLYLSGIHPVLITTAPPAGESPLRSRRWERAHFGPACADWRLENGPWEDPPRHQIPALDHPYLEAGHANARARGIKEVARNIKRRIAWKPGRAGSLSTIPGPNSALPPSASTRGPTSRCAPPAPKVSQRKLRRLVPVFEEHAVDHDLLVEARAPARLFPVGRLFSTPRWSFKEQASSMIILHRLPGLDRQAPPAGSHRNPRNRYFDAETIRERLFLQKASFLQFPHDAIAGISSAAMRIPSSICTSRTAFGRARNRPVGGQLPRQGRR